MEKTDKNVIAWILSRPEGKQFLAGCLFAIVLLGITIIRQEYRYEKVVSERQQSEVNHKEELKACKQETIEILKDANNDAQKMRDSLYTMGMKQKEIEQKINKK